MTNQTQTFEYIPGCDFKADAFKLLDAWTKDDEHGELRVDLLCFELSGWLSDLGLPSLPAWSMIQETVVAWAEFIGPRPSPYNKRGDFDWN